MSEKPRPSCPQADPGNELTEAYFVGPLDDSQTKPFAEFVEHAHGGCPICGPQLDAFKPLHPDSPVFRKKKADA